MVKKTIYFDVMLKSSDRINLNDFKARQKVMTNDKNSVDIVFRATDVEPDDLKGATASIFLYMQDGSFFQSNSVVITNNILTYTMTQNQTQHKGTTKVQIVVKSGTIDNASLLQEFEISPGLEKYPLTEVMIQDWTSLTAEAKAFVDQIEGFTLEQFVENKMGQELANLEVNYATRLTGLEQKDNDLTAQLAQNEKRFEQTDYVELLKRHNKFSQMQLKKTNTANAFEVSVFNEQSHITYEFMYNNDDFMVQTRVWTGGFTEALLKYAEKFFTESVTTTGTWVAVNGSTPAYTDVVGSTFNVTVDVENEGDTIAFQFRSTTRSGLWKFTLDGDTANAVTQSMYNELNTDIVYPIFSNVSKGTHTIVAEFLGEDPTKTYTTAVRGWAQSDSRFFISVNQKAIEPSKDITLTEPSNKEFAFYIKPQNGTTHQFVPFHGDPTAVKVEPAVVKDGAKIIGVSSMGVFDIVFLDSFSLEQHVYGRHPESGTTNLLEIWCTTMISKSDGMLSVDGKMKVLQPITINNSYVNMGTAKGDLFKHVVSSFKNQYFGDSSTYGTNIPMAEERDWAKSYAFLSDTNKNVAIAFRFNNIKETLRHGEVGKDPSGDTMTYLNNRNDAVKKIYSRLWNSSLVEPGYLMRFSGDYIFGINHNFYDLLSLN